MKSIKFTLLAVLLLFTVNLLAQTPGIIVRPAGSAGPSVLDPNSDAYTSLTTDGFGTDDIANSEIPYKTVIPVLSEPTGDLLRGPSGKFTDLVKTLDGSGFYLFNDGTNLLCRLRLGGLVSGSKGYSILFDTDSKIGATGQYADPNYQPATSGNNGNPGFEIEIVLETNFRIAIYNVDGTSTPVLIASYPIASNSQVSVAATTDGGDPDFFYDFYIPHSVMGITATTPLRATATTVMAPTPAIGGPKSDIYGLSGDDYMTDWETIITSQPSFTLNDLTAGGSGIGNTCTAAPTLNSIITPTSTSISGAWKKSIYSSLSTAVITVYKNGTTVLGTTSVASGSTWTLNNVSGLVSGDVISAKAQAFGESRCLNSNLVTVNVCNSSNTPATPLLSCYSGSKGISGTNLFSGWTIHVDNITRGTQENSVNNTGGLFGATTGTSPNINWMFSGGCSTGAPLASGSYKVYYTNTSTGCNSEPVYFCAAGNGQNALAGSIAAPTITSPANSLFTTATQSISGTTVTSATVKLYINGILSQTVTSNASTGTFTFSGLALAANDKIHIIVEKTTASVSTSYCSGQTPVFTVTCFTTPPTIKTDNDGNLSVGSAITGTSFEAAGTTIRVYTSAAVLVSTTTVQANGTWSTSNAGSIPATYLVAANTSYYATAQTGSCGVSSNSATATALTATSASRCGTITGPVTSTASSIAGTLTGTLANTLVTLYLDNIAIGTTTSSNTTWSITVNTTAANTLYSGGVLTIGITEPSKTEVICAASVTIACTPPATPVVTPTIAISGVGQMIGYSISSSTSGILYSIKDNTDATNLGTSMFGNGGTILLTTDAFVTPGPLTLLIKATSFTGADCESFSTVKLYITADTDNDGLADNIDVDDDNDGVTDVNESGGVDPNTDADNDGIPNYIDTNYPGFSDTNNDGINDKLDLDKDGIINAYDIDSDNDGITDFVEAGGVDANGDGKMDGSFTDTNGNGLADVYDASAGGALISNNDTDGDGIVNAFDLDSDGDGILDVTEAGFTDTNADGIVDGTTGTDGWSDTIAALSSVILPDADNDGKPNYEDIDSDNDGITDNVEGQATAAYAKPSGLDSDKDGIDNAYDNNDAAFGGNSNNGIIPNNHDGADEPDYLDTDSDNDGRSDALESNDWNNNKIADENITLTGLDTDGDGLDNVFDLVNGPDVTITGFNGTGSRTVAQKTIAGAMFDRDWRNDLIVLPVTLLQFAVQEKNDLATIQWSAENEVNFEKYDVERSTSGRDFMSIATLKPIDGAVKHDYSTQDDLRKVVSNVIYYRLKMVDKDGTFSYSNVAIIKRNIQLGKTIAVNPNPVIENMQVSITSDVNAKGFISVYNSSGALIYKTEQQLVKGINLIPVQNLSKLSKGTYMIHAVVDGKNLITKFISAK